MSVPSKELPRPCPTCGEVSGGVFCPQDGMPLEGSFSLGGDRYVIEELIGNGAMAIVFGGRHRSFSRPVAVKILRPGVAENAEQQQRFLREARSASQLNHENIVGVLDLGWDDDLGVTYMVMERLFGETLAAQLGGSGKMAWREAMPLLVQICRAVGFAHGLGIVHRDLTSRNVIIVQRAGRRMVKLCDFGLPRQAVGRNQEVLHTGDSGVSGRAPACMAPEPMDNSFAVEASSDIYSIGVLAYEMIAGYPLVGGDGASSIDLVNTLLGEEPRRLVRSPEVELPEELEALILRCLDREPTRRPTAVELEHALVRVDVLATTTSVPLVHLGKQPVASTPVLVVVLGASEFPKMPAWSNPVLGTSAQAFLNYVRSSSGLGVPHHRVLDLFNDEADQVDQCLRIEEFLSREGTAASDLILYYVGHGTFDNEEYCLGIRSTQQGREYLTTIESRKLARSVRNGFPRKRVYLILDSCYAASAAQDWQGDEVNHAIRKLAKALPGHGTAFLAAASKDDVTRAPRAERYTVFTGALLEALTKGVPNAPARLSLSDLHEEVCTLVQQRTDLKSRPELHVPRQREGDISRFPMFPNPAHAPGHDASPSPRSMAAAEESSPPAVAARTQGPLTEPESRAGAQERRVGASAPSATPHFNAPASLPGRDKPSVVDYIAAIGATLNQPISAGRVLDAIVDGVTLRRNAVERRPPSPQGKLEKFFHQPISDPLAWAVIGLFAPMIGPAVFLYCSYKVALAPAAASPALRVARTIGALGAITTVIWLYVIFNGGSS